MYTTEIQGNVKINVNDVELNSGKTAKLLQAKYSGMGPLGQILNSLF